MLVLKIKNKPRIGKVQEWFSYISKKVTLRDNTEKKGYREFI
jgi:hypothetical protein